MDKGLERIGGRRVTVGAEEWNARYARRTQRWSSGPTEIVVREIGDLPPGRALDLGCGEGRNAVWLASRGWQVTAVDFSEVAIERARQRARERGLDVHWVIADVTTVPVDAAFDLVLVVFLQTPAGERARWMARAREALRVGGTFLYIGHDASNLEHGHGGPRYPEVLCTPDEIVRELPGFRIETAGVVERPVSIEPGHERPVEDATALDAVVRAIRIR